MRSIVKRIVCLLFIIFLISTLTVLIVVAQEVDTRTNKRYCQATVDDDFTMDEIIIVVYPEYNEYNYTIADFSLIDCISLKELSYDTVEGKLSRIILLTISSTNKQDALNAIHMLESREDIYSAEPNYLLMVNSTPNDQYYTNNSQWAINKIMLPDAWNITIGSPTVYVGIIDTGIDADHDDLTNRIDVNLSRNFSPDFDTALEDAHGHGTQVASVVGAQGNNTIGMVGVCWNVKLVSLRAGTADGKIYVSALAQAISYAKQQGIMILNFSAGGNDISKYATTQVALDGYSGVLICSAGNENDNTDITPHYPSGLNFDNIISVGASTEADTKRSSSNFGLTTVDLFAPGQGVKVATLNDSYDEVGGTSFAAPHVAGVAALLLSAHPELTATQLKTIILDSADPVPAFANLCVSGGRLNAYEALKTASIHQFSYTANSTGTSHTVACDKSTCNYSYVEPHNLIVSIINDTHHRCTCTDCGYSYISNHDLLKESTSSITDHIIKCTVCDYSVTEAHNYYVLDYDDEDGDGIEDYREWICEECNYSYVCDHLITMSGEYDDQFHYCSCQYCDYTIANIHTLTTVWNEDLVVHQKKCICGYSCNEEHTWVDYSTYYKCLICNKTSYVIPELMKAILPKEIEAETE